MQQQDKLDPDVEELINYVILKSNVSDIKQIKYEPGCNIGDGYLSKSLAVSIIGNEDKKRLELFVKYALKITGSSLLPFEQHYANETNFYKVIYPTYIKFLAQKNVQDSFRNVPRCYGTSEKNVIALENLKRRGYILFDRSQEMNDEHIVLVLQTLAKFHAISFAFKDQKRDEYNKLVQSTYNTMECQNTEEIKRARREAINEFLESLDPSKDKHILDRCEGLADKLIEFCNNSINIKSEYSVLIQGDCWCNNLMFLYKEDISKPLDVMLIDWQMIRNTLPVYDLAFFIYIIASKEALDKLNQFLNVYHYELSHQIRELGSDPEILYPYSVFKQHWKIHAKYGFIMALLNIRLMLTETDEAWDFEKMELDTDVSLPRIRKHDEYLKRLKILAEHLVINEFM